MAEQVIRPLAARHAKAEAQVDLSKRRAWFDGTEGDGGAGGQPNTENPSEGTGDKKGKVTYTPEQQAHIDELMKQQRQQGRSAAQADLLKKLGLEKPEDLEAQLKELADLKKAQMTEQEKRDAEFASEKAKREAAEKRLAEIEARQALEARNGAIVAAAKAAGMTTPEDAIAFLLVNASKDLDGLKADADGNYEEKAVKALVERVRKDRPGWFKPATPGNPSTRTGTPSQPGREARQSDAMATARALRNRA